MSRGAGATVRQPQCCCPLEHRRFAGAGGISMAADVGGPAGAPLVCLGHGGGQTRHSWGVTADRLAATGYRVASIDLRGHGDSDWASDGDYDLPVNALDLEQVVRANDQGSGVCLVGASWGGLTSLVAAPSLAGLSLRAIVLVDVVPRPDPRGGERIRAFMRRHTGGFANVEDAAAAIAAFRPGKPRKDPAELLKTLRTGNDGRLYWRWDPARLNRRVFIDTELIEQAARRITAPVLLMRGELSDVVGDQGVEDLRRLLPALEVVKIDGADHSISGNDNAFLEPLTAFLKRAVPLTPAK